MSLKSVGVLAYSHSFVLGEGHVVFREVGLCDITGEHHVLFNYHLPTGMSWDSKNVGFDLGVE